MAQTTLTQIAGIIAPGRTKVLAIPTMTNYSSPTLAEISTTGVDVTAQVVNGSNWSTSVANPSAASLGSTFVKQARGMISMSGTPSLTFRLAADGADIRATFTKGDTKYMAFGWAGVGTGTYVDIYPTEVANIVPTPDFSGGGFLLVTVEFAVTKSPAYYVAYPAS
jgi:hypothetical protein